MGAFYPQWQKIIRVDVTTPPTTTGYQVKVEIPWQPGMMDDFADLRFSDYYRTLPYWIETSTTRSTATVWIKLTEINEASREFFCYYGNGGAVSESNIVLVGGTGSDHFEGTSLDSKWSPYVSGGSITVSNSLVVMDAPSVSNMDILFSNGDNWGVPNTLRFKAKTKNMGLTTEWTNIGWLNNAQGLGAYACINGGAGTPPNYILVRPTTDREFSATVGWSADTWHIMEISRLSDGSAKYTVDDANLKTLSVKVSTANSGLYFSAYASSVAAKTTLDWVFIRKYQSTEPTCTPAAYGINTAFYQTMMRAKHVLDVATYPYTLAVSFVTDHMHLTWTEP